MKEKRDILICGICVIGLLEIVALLKGYNGVLLTTTIGIIAGLIGWVQKTPKLLDIKE